VLIPSILGWVVKKQVALISEYECEAVGDFIQEPFLLGGVLSFIIYVFDRMSDALYPFFLHLFRLALPEKMGKQKKQLEKQWVELTAEIIAFLIVALAVWLLRAQIGLKNLEFTSSLYIAAAALIMRYSLELLSFVFNVVVSIVPSLSAGFKRVMGVWVVLLIALLYFNFQICMRLARIMAKTSVLASIEDEKQKILTAKNTYFIIQFTIEAYDLLKGIIDYFFAPATKQEAVGSAVPAAGLT